MKILKSQMKKNKYFIVSDIHSYLDELLSALSVTEFDLKNPNHILIINGDVFDRGHQTVALYKWLKEFSQDRLILIHGNHDELLFDMLNSNNYPEYWQFNNGTVKTICAMALMNDEQADDEEEFLNNSHKQGYGFYDYHYITPDGTSRWNQIKELALESEIYKWMKSDIWHNYIELGDYIITHSFIPVKIKKKYQDQANAIIYYAHTELMKHMVDWRKADQNTWFQSMWGRPLMQFNDGLFNKEIAKNKTLVVGHYGTYKMRNDEGLGQIDGADHTIFARPNFIAIDATTAASHMVNVLLIDGKTGKATDAKYGELKFEKEPLKIETVTLDIGDIKHGSNKFSN